MNKTNEILPKICKNKSNKENCFGVEKKIVYTNKL